MALATYLHTPIKDLDDLLRYLTEDLGYRKGVAAYMTNERYKDGDLWLTKVEYVGVKPQGEVPIDPEFGQIELRRGRMQVVPRKPLWRKARYRIAEGCDARAIWPRPPAPLPAPDRQPEDKAGPDPSRTGAARAPSAIPGDDSPKRVSTQEWVTAEAIRLKKAGEIPADAKRYISHFAQLLAKAMEEAAEKAAETNESSFRSVGWRHIKNMLPKWKLWPVESIKIS
jgi:hypothetical protein